jgi:GST-like protein
MLTLYTWTTPNGRKASIMLEEIGASYDVKAINLAKKEQFAPDFQKLSPNNKIPALVDASDGNAPRVLFETGAILLYLAVKSGKLLAVDGRQRDEATEWLFWATSGLAPMLGQWNYFARLSEEKVPLALGRFTSEAIRLFKVLEQRLSESAFLAGEYSIADISAFTWTNAVLPELKKDAADLETPSIDRWLKQINARPAVVRGLQVPNV